MIEDKRQAERIRINLPARYTARVNGKPKENAAIVDITDKGLCFHSFQEFNANQEVKLEIQLHDNSFVVLRAEVVWVKRDGIIKDQFINGVRILDSATEDVLRFKHFCDQGLRNPQHKIK